MGEPRVPYVLTLYSGGRRSEGGGNQKTGLDEIFLPNMIRNKTKKTVMMTATMYMSYYNF